MIKAGEKLAQARLEKGLTLEDVAKNTKIKVQFLEYIEKGQYGNLPSVSYAQGFVKNYAKFLRINEKEVMALFRREFDEDKAFSVLPKGFEKSEEFPISKIRVGQSLILVILILVIAVFYVLYQYRGAFLNPPLTILAPVNRSTVMSSRVEVSGKTDPNATVYIDNNAVSVDQNGNFNEVINVFPGKTLITVKAVNKFSKVSEKKVEINVKAGT